MWSWNQWVLIVSRQSPGMLMRPLAQAVGVRTPLTRTDSVSPATQGVDARTSVAAKLMAPAELLLLL
jgi:hypothetical protein